MKRQIEQLDQLVDLREREVDRLSADLAQQRVVRERYVENLARLTRLHTSSGATGEQAHPASKQVLSPALSLNCGGYKQVVMKMVEAHRLDLSLHEADIATTQRLVTEAARRQEALDQVLTRQRQKFEHIKSVREQKRQDDVATQHWMRRRP
jgi:flagellar export protein FliJ